MRSHHGRPRNAKPKALSVLRALGLGSCEARSTRSTPVTTEAVLPRAAPAFIVAQLLSQFRETEAGFVLSQPRPELLGIRVIGSKARPRSRIRPQDAHRVEADEAEEHG
jgi:hypothetical protein